jgi:hypothetical protein
LFGKKAVGNGSLPLSRRREDCSVRHFTYPHETQQTGAKRNNPATGAGLCGASDKAALPPAGRA